MKTRVRFCFLFLVLILAALNSCGEYEALELQKRAKRTADSMFRVHTDSLKKQADTLCDLNFDKYYKMAFDSLKKSDIEKYNELIKK